MKATLASEKNGVSTLVTIKLIEKEDKLLQDLMNREMISKAFSTLISSNSVESLNDLTIVIGIEK